MAREPRDRVIRDPEFGRRLNKAIDENPAVPAYNFGRLTWIKEQLAIRFNDSYSVESIRKWLAGEVKPRAEALSHMAQLLEVDEAWLSLGVSPNLAPRDQKVRNAAADGAVNLIAGMISMNGAHPAFPADDDKRAQAALIDVYAIIKGAQYAFHVALAREDGDMACFALPTAFEDAFQLGVIQSADLEFILVEIPGELIRDKGSRKGPSIEVELTKDEVSQHQIKSFRNRL